MTTDSPHTGAVTDLHFVVAALYKFVSMPDLVPCRADLMETCATAEVSGTLLLAPEGINGTIAGSRNGIETVLAHIRRIPGCESLDVKESFATENPFFRMKVRLKKEIVTMGLPEIDPTDEVGTFVEPEDWNALISDPDVVVIDTRNAYEVGIGSFKGAIDPGTRSFREFPSWFTAQDALTPSALEGKKVAMFCTGGIRCEKATAFAKQLGLNDVFHLKGGILKYLERVPEDRSLWEGECFVFDQRVSLKHGLALGRHDLCHACRMPIDAEHKASPLYVEGVSCPLCHGNSSPARQRRMEDRQRQVKLAEQRGQAHIGSVRRTAGPAKPDK